MTNTPGRLFSTSASPHFLTLGDQGSSVEITYTITNVGTVDIPGAYVQMPTSLPVEYAGTTYQVPILSISPKSRCAFSKETAGTFAVGQSVTIVMEVSPTHLGTLHFESIRGMDSAGDNTFQMQSVGSIKIVPTNAYFFGDSLSDVGNEFTGPTQVYDLWSNLITLDLNLPPLTPSRLGGSDYAFGGAETGHQPDPTTGVAYGTLDQIGYILNNFNNKLDPNALYFIWAGSNNVSAAFNANPSTASPDAVAAQGVKDIMSALASLQNAGAKNIVVLNLETVYGAGWALPESITGLIYPYNYFYGCTVFNNVLHTAVVALNSANSTNAAYTPVVLYDMGAAFSYMVLHSKASGFLNVSDLCKSNPTTCLAVNQAAAGIEPFLNAVPGTQVTAPVVAWYYWDGHPTSAGHAWIETEVRNYLYPILYPSVVTYP